MDTIWSEDVDNVLRIGKFLENIGVKNWGLTEEQTLAALNKFLRMDVPVLGGDVYFMERGHIEPCYDNWFCNRKKNENKIDFVKRSISKAEEYINDYRGSKFNKLFALVPDL